MAFCAKHFPLFLLFILSSSLHTHARDSQLFNKIPTTNNNINDDVVPYSNNNNNQQPEQEQPNFLPENENGYGLYGHNSGQLPPSAAATTTTAESKQPLPKYLPKNYNPVAYVTEPEDTGDVTTKFAEEKSFTSNPENDKNYYGSARNYYNTPQEESELSEYRNNHATTNDRNSYYINGGSSFNSGGGDALSGRENYFNYGGAGAGGGGNRRFQPQGMSDTRSLENGKYFYDVNTEMYSSNHPYESLRRVRARNEYNNGNYYGNGENEYGFNGVNSMGGYRNQDEFQIEENNLP
ncbi:hypothetical protein DH2020_032788 [Rehmannia glutinosa]|uniref:Protein E6-like n=1 Tax=Rehmannia glutinosa TaxID=99300 RepID=A0ABR0VI59_REHGL